MASTRSAFRLPTSWDIAVVAVERATANGRRRFAVQSRTNGYLRVRTSPGITIRIHVRAESVKSTAITLSGDQSWLGLPLHRTARIRAVLQDLQQDIELHARHYQAATPAQQR
jgi:hypothetical protein